jgi:hypothetical protein
LNFTRSKAIIDWLRRVESLYVLLHVVRRLAEIGTFSASIPIVDTTEGQRRKENSAYRVVRAANGRHDEELVDSLLIRERHTALVHVPEMGIKAWAKPNITFSAIDQSRSLVLGHGVPGQQGSTPLVHVNNITSDHPTNKGSS